MLKIAIMTAAAVATLAPVAASAQALPGAVIAVVDLDRVSSQCTACKSASATLQGQINSLRARQQALATPLEAEGKSIQAAADALPKGTEPPAALQARVRAFQQKQQQGAQELQTRQAQIQRNQAYVSQQISAKLGPIYQQVMQRRGANVMVEQGATLAAGSSLDVTNDVLAALNTALPSVSTTAPAAAAPASQQPQGR
jgi:outer membrane protein